jgi:hypothetical protein
MLSNCEANNHYRHHNEGGVKGREVTKKKSAYCKTNIEKTQTKFHLDWVPQFETSTPTITELP